MTGQPPATCASSSAPRTVPPSCTTWPSSSRPTADFQNYRRRTEQEREQLLGLANESLLRKVLSIVDDFDRAIEAMPSELAKVSWVEGIAAIDRKLRSPLAPEGVTPSAAAGRPV